jgi:glucokinase
LASIGIDVGGTKIGGVVLEGETIGSRNRVNTDNGTSDSVIDGLIGVAEKMTAEVQSKGLQIESIGIGVAGFIDFQRGSVTESPNLPLVDLPLRDIMEKRFETTVVVDNDANAAALGEALLGAGKGSDYVVHLTLGTGIGGGIVIGGRLLRGCVGTAGEPGHMVICEEGPRCTCGGRGCLEAMAGGWAITARVRELSRKGVASPMLEEFRKDPERFSARNIGMHADGGDRFALSILKDAGRHLGVGIASLVNIFNPDVVTLSGGLMGSFEHMRESMLISFEAQSIAASRKSVQIVASTLGDDAGPVGAALLPSAPGLIQRIE